MNYKGKRWERLRERALQSDGYKCRECRRYGLAVDATTVHHVYPADEYPSWRWERWNLISLCAACHNAMHDRNSGALTDKGLAWCRRISPPPSAVSGLRSGTGEGNSFRRKEKQGGG